LAIWGQKKKKEKQDNLVITLGNKKKCWFPVTRPTLILTPDPTKIFSLKKLKNRKIKKIK
jgi:hypothetical protein